MASTYGGGRRRRIVAATAVTAAGLLLWPGAAYAADLTTTPTEARQGEAVRLEFSVPEERAGTKTKQIEIRLPADAPIAEVYPMSVDGWAPRLSSRTLDKPLPGIHSSGVSTVTTAVTWVRVGASEPGPARLALSMGPMPQTERLTFEVVQTYADGTVVRWADASGPHRAPALSLLPAAPGAGGPAAHGGGHAPAAGGPAGEASGVDTGPLSRAGDTDEDAGNADGMLAAGLLAGLGGGATIGWLVSRWRRRNPDEATALAEVTGDPHEVATLAEITGRTDKTAEPSTAGGPANDATTPTETTGHADETATTAHRAPTDPTPADPQPADPQPAVSAASR
ncbi:DUF1775 domain-containing protein [Micromonospora sp. NPDC048835]|uniref:DUF1775 domain-containing protein n=1 Tax=Micromonospora sp. NPDC048835 TaxID=3155147 RepID=UPI0033E0F6A3